MKKFPQKNSENFLDDKNKVFHRVSCGKITIYTLCGGD
jgi:hypothetical protein